MARPPLPPGKRSVRTGGLVRGSDGRDGHTPGSAQSQNPPRFLCARCGNKKGQDAGLRGRPGLREQGGREAGGPSSRFPKLQPQSSRGGGGDTASPRASRAISDPREVGMWAEPLARAVIGATNTSWGERAGETARDA